MSKEFPYLLLLETSGAVCSVALAKGQEVIVHLEQYEANSHSTYLAAMVNDLLKLKSLTVNDIDAIAISGGPGSYTGLRIGCSLAKGLCYGRNIPLIACSTLAATAQSLGTVAKPILSLIDARRMDAYAAVYVDHRLVLDEHFTTLDEDFLAKLSLDEYAVVGSGAKKFVDWAASNAFQLYEASLLAEHMLEEAFQKFNSSDFVDVAYYEPNYIKSVFVTKPKKKF